MRLFCLTILFSILLTGCGQKGALYLPDDAAPRPPTIQSPNTQSQNSEAAPVPTIPAK